MLVRCQSLPSAASGRLFRRSPALAIHPVRLCSRPPHCRRQPLRVAAAHGAESRSSYTADTNGPEVVAGSSTEGDGYGYQQQPYVGVPQYPVAPPPQTAAAAPSGGGLPWYLWVVLGVILAKTWDLFSRVFRGGPQNAGQNVQQMMMEQMMKAAMGQAAGGAGAPNPFGGAGAPNPFGAGFPSGFPSPPAAGGSSPFSPPPGFPPAYDTTASPAGASPAQSSAQPPPQTSSAQAASSATSWPSSSAQSPLKEKETVYPTSSTSATQQRDDSPPKPAAFTDVTDEPPRSEAAASSTQGSFFQDAEQSGNGSGAQAAAGGQAKGTPVDMMEKMMRDPNMQKLLYPYLPEPMRNPETFEWMLSNPEYRKQLETMLNQQAMNPAMGDMMANFDMNSNELKSQLDQIGMTPDQVLQKIMADPELAMSFSNPKVQAAVMEVSQNPMSVVKYQNDPEVMKVFEKMTELFPAAAMQGGAPAGMPPP